MRWRESRRYEKMRQYAAEMRPVFKSRAVFSDETEAYRTPCTVMYDHSRDLYMVAT